MSQSLQWRADSEQAQEALGAHLARACPAQCVILLAGDLGAGKTTLTRGFLHGLGHRGQVKSPTYTLLEPYRVGPRQVLHFDLYRLSDPEELEYLGLRDLLDEPAVWLVEWPDRGAGWLPAADLQIDIRHRLDGRDLTVTALGEVGEQALRALKSQLAD